MPTTVHVGLLHLLITAAEVVLIFFFARAFAVRYADTSAGKAVAWLL